ncbi:hypothetical protein RIF24_06485 [Exiguobacterium acetylicum]|uniref:hypothetical protein n=1 Tax=Exiguobacterium acetylicum TaxID=41170 RepID=UPI003977CB9C
MNRIERFEFEFEENEGERLPLFTYLEQQQAEWTSLQDDEAREGIFHVSMWISGEKISWSYDVRERDEATQAFRFGIFVQRWKNIWEWYQQRHLISGNAFGVHKTLADSVRTSAKSEEHLKWALNELAGYDAEGLLFYFGPGPWDDFQNADDELNMFLEFDEINTKEKMRTEGLYFDYDSQRWIDIPASLPVIGETMLVMYRQLYE